MASINSCNICNRKVLRHSYHRKCTLCELYLHIKCLPNVNNNDSIYSNREFDHWYCTKCTSDLFPFNHFSDDDEFKKSISESWNLPITIPYNLINNQENILLPFDLNENFDNPLSDMDPDLQ